MIPLILCPVFLYGMYRCTENGSIIIRKAARKRRAVKSLEERFEGYSGDYRCSEADTGKPVGMEVW